MKDYETPRNAKVESAHKEGVRDESPKRKNCLQITFRESRWKRRVYILLKQEKS